MSSVIIIVIAGQRRPPLREKLYGDLIAALKKTASFVRATGVDIYLEEAIEEEEIVVALSFPGKLISLANNYCCCSWFHCSGMRYEQVL